MSDVIHMTAPDGRGFTFKEWCEYVGSGKDLEPYRTADGSIFNVEGFTFNAHGYCLNPHTIKIAEPDGRTYVEVRTYRRYANKDNTLPVWYYSLFSINCDAHGFGAMVPSATEKQAVITALRQAIKSIKNKIEWLEHVIEAEKASGFDARHSTYPACLEHNRRMEQLVLQELDKQLQLELF